MMNSPYRFLLAAGLIAALLCLFPVHVDAPQETAMQQAENREAPAHADLSERTQSGCMLHATLYYAACGHSVQRRTKLPARLVGLTRDALTAQLPDALPGAVMTGFSGAEVDVSQQMDMPCPLHWVLRAGGDGKLEIMQNRTGEALETVRGTDIPLDRLSGVEREAMADGRVFDSVQALEGYLESLSS